MTTTTCTRCPSPVTDRAFLLCAACVAAVLAAEAALGDVETIAPDPFFDVRPAWVEGVWAKVCATIGGMW